MRGPAYSNTFARVNEMFRSSVSFKLLCKLLHVLIKSSLGPIYASTSKQQTLV